MTMRRVLSAVAFLALANVGFWALTQEQLAARETKAEPVVVEYPRDCWFTTTAMGCSEWLFGGCEDVSDCSTHGGTN